jgi:hypothetical protein
VPLKTQPPARLPNVGDVEMRKVRGRHLPPVRFEGTQEVEWADMAFETALAASGRLARLLTTLEDHGSRYCVFGGWLRDTVSSHSRGTLGPRDLDLVAANIEPGLLIAALPADIRPTIFGGIQSSAGPLQFDIWPLHETFLIRKLSLPASFDSLLETADFDINAGLYFPAQAKQPSSIIDAGMLNAIRRGRLAFNSHHLPFPILQCARLLAYRAKLDLDLDPDVLSFMREILIVPSSRAQVADGLLRHQPPAVAKEAIAAIKQVIEGVD